MRDFEDTSDPEIKLRHPQRVYYYIGTPSRGSGSIQRSLKTKSFKQAQLEKRRLLVELGSMDINSRACTFGDLAQTVLKKYDQEIKAAVGFRKQKIAETKVPVESYLRKHLVPFFGNKKLSEINEALWNKYLDKEIEKAKDKVRDFASDRRFFRQCLMTGRNAGLSVAIPPLDVPKFQKKLRRILTPREVKLLYENARGSLKALILCMYKMGFRPAEVTKLRWDRVSFETNKITLLEEDVKANARTIVMNPQVRDMLLERHKTTDSMWVFPTRSKRRRKKGATKTVYVGDSPLDRYHKQWERLLTSKKVGIEDDPDVYCLRHTFLTEACNRVKKKELSIHEVAEYAGTSIEMLQERYLHMTPEDTADVATLMDIGGAI